MILAGYWQLLGLHLPVCIMTGDGWCLSKFDSCKWVLVVCDHQVSMSWEPTNSHDHHKHICSPPSQSCQNLISYNHDPCYVQLVPSCNLCAIDVWITTGNRWQPPSTFHHQNLISYISWSMLNGNNTCGITHSISLLSPPSATYLLYLSSIRMSSNKWVTSHAPKLWNIYHYLV